MSLITEWKHHLCKCIPFFILYIINMFWKWNDAIRQGTYANASVMVLGETYLDIKHPLWLMKTFCTTHLSPTNIREIPSLPNQLNNITLRSIPPSFDPTPAPTPTPPPSATIAIVHRLIHITITKSEHSPINIMPKSWRGKQELGEKCWPSFREGSQESTSGVWLPMQLELKRALT